MSEEEGEVAEAAPAPTNNWEINDAEGQRVRSSGILRWSWWHVYERYSKYVSALLFITWMQNHGRIKLLVWWELLKSLDSAAIILSVFFLLSIQVKDCIVMCMRIRRFSRHLMQWSWLLFQGIISRVGELNRIYIFEKVEFDIYSRGGTGGWGVRNVPGNFR